MTLNKWFQVSTLWVAVCAASACGPVLGPSSMPADVIRAHYDAMNREDLDEAMSYIEDGPNRTATRIATEQVFTNYDMRYSVEILGYLTSDKKGETRVKVIQTTERIAGPLFVNNRTTIVYTMKEGWFSWKMASAEVKEIERL